MLTEVGNVLRRLWVSGLIAGLVAALAFGALFQMLRSASCDRAATAPSRNDKQRARQWVAAHHGPPVSASAAVTCGQPFVADWFEKWAHCAVTLPSQERLRLRCPLSADVDSDCEEIERP